jgi:hypothetical protein
MKKWHLCRTGNQERASYLAVFGGMKLFSRRQQSGLAVIILIRGQAGTINHPKLGKIRLTGEISRM